MSSAELCNSPGMDIQITISERLTREKRNLELRLGQVDTALELLKENPKIKEVIEAISRITHF